VIGNLTDPFELTDSVADAEEDTTKTTSAASLARPTKSLTVSLAPVVLAVWFPTLTTCIQQNSGASTYHNSLSCFCSVGYGLLFLHCLCNPIVNCVLGISSCWRNMQEGEMREGERAQVCIPSPVSSLAHLLEKDVANMGTLLNQQAINLSCRDSRTFSQLGQGMVYWQPPEPAGRQERNRRRGKPNFVESAKGNADFGRCTSLWTY